MKTVEAHVCSEEVVSSVLSWVQNPLPTHIVFLRSAYEDARRIALAASDDGVEDGGCLAGVYIRPARTAVVTHILHGSSSRKSLALLDSRPDSEEMTAQLGALNEKCGGLLFNLGRIHRHPGCFGQPSGTDHRAYEELCQEGPLDGILCPIMIVPSAGQVEFKGWVFEQERGPYPVQVETCTTAEFVAALSAAPAPVKEAGARIAQLIGRDPATELAADSSTPDLRTQTDGPRQTPFPFVAEPVGADVRPASRLQARTVRLWTRAWSIWPAIRRPALAGLAVLVVSLLVGLCSLQSQNQHLREALTEVRASESLRQDELKSLNESLRHFETANAAEHARHKEATERQAERLAGLARTQADLQTGLKRTQDGIAKAIAQSQNASTATREAWHSMALAVAELSNRAEKTNEVLEASLEEQSRLRASVMRPQGATAGMPERLTQVAGRSHLVEPELRPVLADLVALVSALWSAPPEHPEQPQQPANRPK